MKNLPRADAESDGARLAAASLTQATLNLVSSLHFVYFKFIFTLGAPKILKKGYKGLFMTNPTRGKHCCCCLTDHDLSLHSITKVRFRYLFSMCRVFKLPRMSRRQRPLKAAPTLLSSDKN